MAKTLSRIKKVDIEIVEDNEIKEETIVVKKAPLGRWKKITDSIKVLFDLLPEVLEDQGVKDIESYLLEMSEQDIIMLLPDMIEVATDEVFNLLSLGAGVDKKFIEEKVGLDEAVELFEAIVEVNKLMKVVEKAKNIMNLWEKIKE